MPACVWSRLAPQFSFPAYAYVPGKNAPHHFAYEGSVALDGENPRHSECLCFAMDLYRAGFYWETHVCLEALWISQGRSGTVADFIKALIQGAAAALKMKMEKNESARHHLRRMKDLVNEISGDSKVILGFDLERLLVEIDFASDSFQPVILSPEWTE